MSALQQQRKIVEQLRREAGIRRLNTSIAIEDLKKYIQDHENDDYLL
ncbi:guanine nucleotide-binding protein subunit gamma-1-like protein, partial [Dinothrombium tinctorium]